MKADDVRFQINGLSICIDGPCDIEIDTELMVLHVKVRDTFLLTEQEREQARFGPVSGPRSSGASLTSFGSGWPAA